MKPLPQNGREIGKVLNKDFADRSHGVAVELVVVVLGATAEVLLPGGRRIELGATPIIICSRKRLCITRGISQGNASGWIASGISGPYW